MQAAATPQLAPDACPDDCNDDCGKRTLLFFGVFSPFLGWFAFFGVIGYANNLNNNGNWWYYYDWIIHEQFVFNFPLLICFTVACILTLVGMRQFTAAPLSERRNQHFNCIFVWSIVLFSCSLTWIIPTFFNDLWWLRRVDWYCNHNSYSYYSRYTNDQFCGMVAFGVLQFIATIFNLGTSITMLVIVSKIPEWCDEGCAQANTCGCPCCHVRHVQLTVGGGAPVAVAGGGQAMYPSMMPGVAVNMSQPDAIAQWVQGELKLGPDVTAAFIRNGYVNMQAVCMIQTNRELDAIGVTTNQEMILLSIRAKKNGQQLVAQEGELVTRQVA